MTRLASDRSTAPKPDRLPALQIADDDAIDVSFPNEVESLLASHRLTGVAHPTRYSIVPSATRAATYSTDRFFATRKRDDPGASIAKDLDNHAARREARKSIGIPQLAFPADKEKACTNSSSQKEARKTPLPL